MRKDVFKKGSIISVLLLIVIAGSLYAEEKKEYPPYPEVWGHELPWPSKDSRRSGIEIAKMPNGDYMVTYVKKRDKVRTKDSSGWDFRSEFAGFLFFRGEQKSFVEDQIDEFWKLARNENRVVRQEGITLEDGSKIRWRSDGDGRCCPVFTVYLEKVDKNGRIAARKSLIYLLDKPLKKWVNQYCEYNESLNKDYIIQKVVGIAYIYFVPLEDGTFLLVDGEGNLLIRFDRNLNSKSDLINNKVFVVDWDVLRDVAERLKGKELPNDQERTDAVYKLVLKLKKGAER